MTVDEHVFKRAIAVRIGSRNGKMIFSLNHRCLSLNAFFEGCCAVINRGTGKTYLSILNDTTQPYGGNRIRLAQRFGEQWVLQFEEWARDRTTGSLADMLALARTRNSDEPLHFMELSAPIRKNYLQGATDDMRYATRRERDVLMTRLKVGNIGAHHYRGLTVADRLVKWEKSQSDQFKAVIEDAESLEKLCKRFPCAGASHSRDVARDVIYESAPKFASTLGCCLR